MLAPRFMRCSKVDWEVVAVAAPFGSAAAAGVVAATMLETRSTSCAPHRDFPALAACNTLMLRCVYKTSMFDDDDEDAGAPAVEVEALSCCPFATMLAPRFMRCSKDGGMAAGVVVAATMLDTRCTSCAPHRDFPALAACKTLRLRCV